MQVVQVADQMERVFQMALLLLALLPEQVGEVQIPEQEDVLLLLGDVPARGDERREDRLGAELQRPQQVFQLPEVEYVFGDIFPPFGFRYVHFIGICMGCGPPLPLFDPVFRLVAVAEEVLLRLEQVARLEHHVLRLVEYRQIARTPGA